MKLIRVLQLDGKATFYNVDNLARLSSNNGYSEIVFGVAPNFGYYYIAEDAEAVATALVSEKSIILVSQIESPSSDLSFITF